MASQPVLYGDKLTQNVKLLNSNSNDGLCKFAILGWIVECIIEMDGSWKLRGDSNIQGLRAGSLKGVHVACHLTPVI